MSTWHAEPHVLERYAQGRTDEVLAASVEAHLVACAACREELGRHVPTPRLDAGWAAVVAELDAPRPGWFERLLVRAAVPEHTARLLAATPALRWSWLCSVLLSVGAAVLVAARPGSAPLAFLMLAPVVPVATVSIAFSSLLDESWEMLRTAAGAGMRLLLLRAVASVGPSVVAAATVSLFVDTGDSAALWLLPALALTVSSLLAASYIPVEAAAGLFCAIWTLGVVATEAQARGGIAALRADGEVTSVLAGPPAQLVAGLVAVAGAALLAARNLRLPPREETYLR